MSAISRNSLTGNCAAFVADAVRTIRRESRHGVAAVDAAVVQFVERIGEVRESDEARLAIYDAAVRASSSQWAAGQALDLLLSRPGGFGSSEAALSQALFFAVAAGRPDDLLRRLDAARAEQTDADSQFDNLMACAKLSLAYEWLEAVTEHVGRTSALPIPAEAAERARGLRRAARWLGPASGSGISQWRLRPLHHLLTREAAERLEEGDPALFDGDAALPALRRALTAATGRLRTAARIAEDPNGERPLLRRALADWAMAVGRTLAESESANADAAVPFTATAWRLLGPNPPAEVVDAHVRAVAGACASFPEPVVAMTGRAVADALPTIAAEFVPAVLRAWESMRRREEHGDFDGPAERVVRLLDRVAAERPRPSLETALPEVSNRLAGISVETLETIETCLMDRALLLPDEPPFRGRAWFASDAAHQLYEMGRDAPDSTAAYQAFELAWRHEPNNWIAVQGLIHGLRRRLGPKPSRDHLLRHIAGVLGQIVEHEVEAALAYSALADLAALARDQRRRRRYLAAAVAELQKRQRRSAWTKARNAEIAVLLELGSLNRAGDAAWAESCLYLPGSEASKRYALVAATLWERSGPVDATVELRIDAARDRASASPPSPGTAIQHAVDARRLVLLRGERLDDDALEDLLWACRGNEEEVFRFLKAQATRRIDPRPEYLPFLARHRPELALPPRPDPDGGRDVARLRLAAAEVLSRDPLSELAISRDSMTEPHLSEFMALLRECAGANESAVHAFDVAIHQALSALFELRVASPTTTAELHGARLSTAALALDQIKQVADLFQPALDRVAHLLWRHLSLALDAPMIDAYLGEKGKRLVPSTLSTRLGRWWMDLCTGAGPLDLFHHHKAYRCPPGRSPEEWWANHEVYGRPIQEAVRDLLESLEASANQLTAIDVYYQAYRRRQPGPPGFGLSVEFERCCAVLRAALQPGAGPDERRRIAAALEALTTSLRRIDMARLHLPDVMYDGLPEQVYVLPRADELLGHWRQNAGSEPHRQFMFEVQDDAAHDVLCLMSVDAGSQPVPETVKLRGLEPFADLVEALGGQFHLWVARTGEPGGCRIEHADGVACTADEYVARMAERLQELATTWPLRHAEIRSWLANLDAALRARGNVALAFSILPRVRE